MIALRDNWTRLVAALMLALLVVTPVVGPVCEALAAPAPMSPAECAAVCEEAGFMPLDCATDMRDDGSCGDMLPAPERQRDEAPASANPVKAPDGVALTASQPLLDDGSGSVTPFRASSVERPPLDPLGVRIRI